MNPTAKAIDSLLKFNENKRVKQSTLYTYRNLLKLFRRKFVFLPEKPEIIMDFLSRFNGETGRHRRNYQDLLNVLYKQAVSHLGLPKNPLEGLERPIVTHKPIRTLSLEQVGTLNTTPETIGERTALDLMLGYGWRQVDVRRILAADVRNIDKGLIWCHGKERDEDAPILPETAKLLTQMAHGLKSEDHVFLAEHTRDTSCKPLGEDRMAQPVHRLLRKAKLRGFTGHDLHRSFATLVNAASGDEFLAMRLLRDTVPGLSSRYIQFPRRG